VTGTVTATRFLGDGSGLSGIASQWITNGTAVYYNTGNVGIGTTAPVRYLEFGQKCPKRYSFYKYGR